MTNTIIKLAPQFKEGIQLRNIFLKYIATLSEDVKRTFFINTTFGPQWEK